MDPLQPGPSVKISVKAQDRSDTAALHHRNVDGIARREHGWILGDLACAQHITLFDRENLVNDIQNHLKCRSDSVPSVDRRIPTEYFLQNLGIRHETLSRGNQAFQENLRIGLMRMRGSDKIHRNVRVDKNQAS